MWGSGPRLLVFTSWLSPTLTTCGNGQVTSLLDASVSPSVQWEQYSTCVLRVFSGLNEPDLEAISAVPGS